jgi:hypothetical protein
MSRWLGRDVGPQPENGRGYGGACLAIIGSGFTPILTDITSTLAVKSSHSHWLVSGSLRQRHSKNRKSTKLLR